MADPDHAVDPPGPRSGRLVAADILVTSPDTIEDDLVEQITRTKGVSQVEQISLAQLAVEEQMLTVVAAEPSTYRNFTPLASADVQEIWTRVAGGEVAVSDQLRKTLPVDGEGFVQLGTGDDAESLHVGAFAPQIEGAVDAAVNPRWGEEMGMPEGNALLISTMRTAPDRVVPPITDLVGDGVSVQRLDVVAREGLDVDAVQTAVVVGSVADAVGHYTYTVSGGAVTPDPAWVSSHISTEQVPILGSVTCNKALMPQLRAALQEIVDLGLASEIRPDDYAGCYYPRFIAGTTTLSNHAFGTALDINVSTNGRGIPGDMHPQVVSTFKKWGFAWGGDWQYTDPMHFEMARIVEPG
ncbi:M15 family metallopeptidase [Nocardioides insulae]|uniref:M15 family metallopeptidase n=1 Tax=Nocardioides insulae TaxID=394734 RepID=UPI001FE20BE5|nr:M15 family metallopeptidase [Nocardioides insulae]